LFGFFVLSGCVARKSNDAEVKIETVSDRTENVALIISAALKDDSAPRQWSKYNSGLRLDLLFQWLGYSSTRIQRSYISADDCKTHIFECVVDFMPKLGGLTKNSSLAVFVGGHGGVTQGNGATVCSNASNFSTKWLIDQIEAALPVPSIASLTLFHDTCFAGQIVTFFQDYVRQKQPRFRQIVAYASTQANNYSYDSRSNWNSKESVIGNTFVVGLFEARDYFSTGVPTINQFLDTATTASVKWSRKSNESSVPQKFIWPQAAGETAMLLKRFSDRGYIVDFNVMPNDAYTAVGNCFDHVKQRAAASGNVYLRLRFQDEFYGNGQLFVGGGREVAEGLLGYFDSAKCSRIPPSIRPHGDAVSGSVRIAAQIWKGNEKDMHECIAKTFRPSAARSQVPSIFYSGLKLRDVNPSQVEMAERDVVTLYSDDLEYVNSLGCGTLYPFFNNR
jgi:hypothetical protein